MGVTSKVFMKIYLPSSWSFFLAARNKLQLLSKYFFKIYTDFRNFQIVAAWYNFDYSETESQEKENNALKKKINKSTNWAVQYIHWQKN